MIKNIGKMLLAGAAVFGFFGCEGDNQAQSDGSHFPGKDCLACHTSDLSSQKSLAMAGTLYQRHDVTDPQDLGTLCGGTLYLRLVDVASGEVYDINASSSLHEATRGARGKGNLFVLSEELPTLTPGDYAVQIWSDNGYLLAASKDVHPFLGTAYSLSTPDASGNRVSCNACHRQDGSALPLYVQQNTNQCQ